MSAHKASPKTPKASNNQNTQIHTQLRDQLLRMQEQEKQQRKELQKQSKQEQTKQEQTKQEHAKQAQQKIPHKPDSKQDSKQDDKAKLAKHTPIVATASSQTYVPTVQHTEPEEIDDKALFAKAVGAMDNYAESLLAKYDDKPSNKLQSALPPAKAVVPEKADFDLFMQFVGQVSPVELQHAKALESLPEKPTADAKMWRNVLRGQKKPAISVDLHGMDQEQAKQKLHKFLVDAQRLGMENNEMFALVVHGKGTGTLKQTVLAMLQTHETVAEHVAAPLAFGGEGARLVRLRRR